MPKRVRSLRCPICRKIVLRSEPEFPFCSERCRVIDLGKWASEGYVISTAVTDPEELMGIEALEREKQKQHSANKENPDNLHGHRPH